MNARNPERCRSVGLVEDLRDVWAELGEALRSVDDAFAKPWLPREDMEWQGVKELLHSSIPNL